MSVHKFLKSCIRMRPKTKAECDQPGVCLGRQTSPDAKMNLILRFETEQGPRSVVAPGVPLALASAIAHEMLRCGHFADYVDYLPAMSVTERIRQGRDAAFVQTFHETERMHAIDGASGQSGAQAKGKLTARKNGHKRWHKNAAETWVYAPVA